tara:strand:- start:5668 stop:6141 length:474 start_codon:yes stop_codon:yes gene_type:complete
MEIQVICIGKTDDIESRKIISNYENRLKHYVKFNFLYLPDLKETKNLSQEQQKAKEALLIEKQLKTSDVVILLDENGKQFSSVNFSEFLNKKMSSGCKSLVFIIGGAYGLAQTLHQKYVFKISLSKMTFSHQMIRLLFVEQLYRANTILKNEPYHHR